MNLNKEWAPAHASTRLGWAPRNKNTTHSSFLFCRSCRSLSRSYRSNAIGMPKPKQLKTYRGLACDDKVTCSMLTFFCPFQSLNQIQCCLFKFRINDNLLIDLKEWNQNEGTNKQTEFIMAVVIISSVSFSLSRCLARFALGCCATTANDEQMEKRNWTIFHLALCRSRAPTILSDEYVFCVAVGSVVNFN